MGRAATVAALVPGGILALAVLGVAGAARRRKGLLFAAGFGMLCETAFVFTIAPLTLVAGMAFLLLVGQLTREATSTS